VIAGKTSSPDFPQVGGVIGNFPFVTMECLLWTPEVGFLARLSADGRQLNFSGYVALDGDQLDDCSGGLASFNPARLATDSSGNIYVAGSTTPSNRYFQASAGSIIPDQSHWGGQLLQIFSADGSRKIYASALPSNGVTGIAVDPWQNIVVASGYSLQRIASGSMPVQIQANPSVGCANQPLVLTASVAASNDIGAIDFAVDGVGLGSASIANGIASKTVTISTVGVRKLSATYHGAGPFDGYASPDLPIALNQAGTCQ
jgi:hypothetical protein